MLHGGWDMGLRTGESEAVGSRKPSGPGQWAEQPSWGETGRRYPAGMGKEAERGEATAVVSGQQTPSSGGGGGGVFGLSYTDPESSVSPCASVSSSGLWE